MRTAKEYRDTPEYEILRREIIKEIVRVTDMCIVAPDMNQKEYARGYADALKNMLLLPDAALPKDESGEEPLLEESPESTLGTILIANQPNDREVW